MPFWWVFMIYRGIFQLLYLFFPIITSYGISSWYFYVVYLKNQFSWTFRRRHGWQCCFCSSPSLLTGLSLCLYPPQFWFIFQTLLLSVEACPEREPHLNGFRNSQELDFSRPISPYWKSLVLTHCWIGQSPSDFSCWSQVVPLSSPLHTCWAFGNFPTLKSSRHPFASICFLLHRCWELVDRVTVDDFIFRGLRRKCCHPLLFKCCPWQCGFAI